MRLQLLGVFTQIYGQDAEMTISRALLISAVGFLLVFLILGILAIFVKLMGTVFDKLSASSTVNEAVGTYPAEGTPLPENRSEGTLVLENVSEEEAAIIMAIVSDESGIPLNRLKFNSIKLSEENK